MTIDQGGSSGVAWARIRDEGTIAERLAASPAEWRGSATLTGHWQVQMRELSELWFDFRRQCRKAGLPSFLAMEDFILTRMKSSDRKGLYPVWVGAAMYGYRAGLAAGFESGGFGKAETPEVHWVQPSDHMTYATDERLKRWGLWVPGREHERDAWRILAFFVAAKKFQTMRAARARHLARTRMHT